MTSVAPQPAPRVFEHYLDPKSESSVVTRYRLIAVGSAALAVVGVVLFAAGSSWRGILLAVLGALSTAIFVWLSIHQKKLGALTGDDLLIVAIDEQGILGPDKVRAFWSEITGIEFREMNGGRARSTMVSTSDPAALVARAVGRQRKYVGKDRSSGLLGIGLGRIPDDAYGRLQALLREEGQRRGFPVELHSS